jgi:hypothetical protein
VHVGMGPRIGMICGRGCLRACGVRCGLGLSVPAVSVVAPERVAESADGCQGLAAGICRWPDPASSAVRAGLNRQATRALVRRLYPGHQVSNLADGTLLDQANPDNDRIYAGCFAGLTVVCTSEAALDRPSQLDPRFLREAAGRRLYLHAMHSVVDWFAYAIWSADGALVRALSVSPLTGIAEDIDCRLAFEEPYWSGQQPITTTGWNGTTYPFPFHPLEFGEAALRALFGFNYEGLCRDGDPDLEQIALAGFALQPTLGS